MARFKHGAKSAAIREYLSQHPGAMPKDVIVALKAKNLKVSAQMVSVLRGKQKGGARRGRATANGLAGADVLIQAKAMADRLGGVAQAQEALSVLAKLL